MRGKGTRFTIKSDIVENLSIDHTIGSVERFQKWELKKVLIKISTIYPESPAKIMLDTLQSYYFEDDSTEDSVVNRTIAPFFPHLLLYFGEKKLDKVTTALLWVVSCYWYYNCGGPNPGEGAKKHTAPKQQKWVVDLRCPVCNMVPPKSKIDTSKGEEQTLRDFSKWMFIHAKTCQSRLSLYQKREAIKRREELEKARNSREASIRNQWLEAKRLEPEVSKALRSGWKAQDELYRLSDQLKVLQAQQDSMSIELGVKKALVNITKGYVPLTPKEQYRYADLVIAINRIKQLLDLIKGKRGVADKRKKLQADLVKFQAEFDTLNERRTYAGEEK